MLNVPGRRKRGRKSKTKTKIEFALKPPGRRRIDMMIDCLLVLAEGSEDDARAVIKALSSMEQLSSFGLAALFRVADLPSTTRENLAKSALGEGG